MIKTQNGKSDIPPSPLPKYFSKMAEWLKRKARAGLILSNAALAFMITMLVQIRLQGPIESTMFAKVGLGAFIIAAIVGYYIQARLGAKSVMVEGMKASKEISEVTEKLLDPNPVTKKEMARRRDLMDEYVKEAKEIPLDRSFPIYAIMLQWIAIAVGVLTSSIFFWWFLFCA